MLKINSSLVGQKKNTKKGKAIEHNIEATETTRKTKNATNQTKITSKKINLSSATITASPARTPSVVATPLPP